MRLILSILILIPFLVQAQSFQKVITGSYILYPIDLMEISEGYLLLAHERMEDESLGQAKIYKIDKSGNILNSIAFNSHYTDRFTKAIVLNDSTYLVTGYIQNSHSDAAKLKFYLINNDLDILKQEIVETVIDSASLAGALFIQSQLLVLNNTIINAIGYHSLSDTAVNGLYLVKFDELLNNIEVKHYANLALPFYSESLPQSLLPFNDSDTTLLFLYGEVYKLDGNCNIVDSLPEDFHFFHTENYIYNVGRPQSARWLGDKLIIGGSGRVFLYNTDLTKDTLLAFDNSDTVISAAIYGCMDVNENYAYLGFMLHLWQEFAMCDNSLRILKIDNKLNIYWDKIYNEKDGFFYGATNTLATKDGGCIITAMRANMDTQDEKSDIYLLKVDSLGNYDTTTTIINNKEPEYRVYPNPGNEYLTIELNNQADINELILYNNFGQIVLHKQLLDKNEIINTAHLPQGVYIYGLTYKGVLLKRGKWIKQK